MQHEVKVLDYGFVRVVDTMGDDAAIVQAARVSYGEGTKNISDDRGLIRYLMRHWHSTPFEMCEIKLHVKLPIFIARQWIRHRTANVNEVSARYSILDREFYIPDAEQMLQQSKINKQGRSEEDVGSVLGDMQQAIGSHSNLAYALYESLLDEGGGLTRELSRMVLPLNIYTQWYWKTDLHNLFHFLRLRSDPHAQWEIQQYAHAIGGFVALWCPIAWEAYIDYRRDAVTMSRMEMTALRTMLATVGRGRIEQVFLDEFGLSRREVEEFKEKLKLG